MNEDKSTRYQRLRRRAWVLTLATRAAVPLGLLGLGLAPPLRDLAGRLADAVGASPRVGPLLTVLIFAAILGVATELMVTPLSWYREAVLERRFGRSRRRDPDWARGRVAASTLHVVVLAAAAGGGYGVVWLWPAGWWMVGGIVFAGAMLVVTHIAPVLVLPRLYELRPLRRPGLRERLEVLARRAGVPVLEISEWVLGRDRPQPNAALVGIGATQRVLLTDALLADYSDDEIEVVVAHELAHHVHGDVWKTVAYEAVAVTLACAAAHWSLVVVGPTLGVRAVGDVAGLPLALATGGAVVLLLLPLANVLSRHLERRADTYALEVTGNPAALASGLRRVAAQRLAEARPPRLVEWLFYTHPPLSDRLAAARAAARPGVPQTTA